jgi:hypothetical protein
VSGRPELTELHIADPPERWEALGFAVDDHQMTLGGIQVHLGAQGRGITRWAIRDIPHTDAIDGLPTTSASPPRKPPFPTTHPNGATGIDHVVILTPDFDRTSKALEQADMPLRRVGDAGNLRQGFRRLGPTILELVEAEAVPEGPARFWGLVVIVTDLQVLASRLADHLGPIKPAVQPGRRIATLRPSAGLTPNLALMTSEP